MLMFVLYGCKLGAALAKSGPLDFPSEKKFSFIFCP